MKSMFMSIPALVRVFKFIQIVEVEVDLIPIISASLVRAQTGGNCDFDIGDDWNRFKAENGENVLSFDLPSWWDQYLN